MRRRALSGTSTARAVIQLLEKVYRAEELVKALRPAELDYLCQVCDVISQLKLCDDFDYEEEED